jgi:dethiobiotin synthetase
LVVWDRSNILPARGASKDVSLHPCWRAGLLKKTMQGLFFTGTDTGVGKTLITAAVARILRTQGHDVCLCKPVATGAALVDGRWLSDDTRRLAEAEGNREAWQDITPWSFPDPVAPPVAACRQGIRLSLDEIAAAVRRRSRPEARVLVEGVGGLLCPLTEEATVADLAQELKLSLIVVTRQSLGTLNHTLLTLEAAASRGLPIAGIVVNQTMPDQGLADQTNVEELRKRIRIPILAVLPYQNSAPSHDLFGLAEVDWNRLCHWEARSRIKSEEHYPAWKP